MTVSGADDGRTWQVRRRWMPRLGQDTLWGRIRRRYRRTFRRVGDVADGDLGCLDAIGESLVVSLVALVVVLLLVFIGIPLVVALVDVVLLSLLALGGLLARVLFNRPWLIEASDGTASVLRWRITGWRQPRAGRADPRPARGRHRPARRRGDRPGPPRTARRLRGV